MKNRKLSKKHISKLKANHKGMTGLHHSEETKRKIGKANKGHKMSEKNKLQISKRFIGRKLTKEHKMKILRKGDKHGSWKGGKPNCVICGKKLVSYTAKRCNKHKGLRGERSPHWKGGITPINKLIRESLDYKEWRNKIFKRDNYTCQTCGQIGRYLQADHIKPFALYSNLRFELSNGRTLCKMCHQKTSTYGRYQRYRIIQSVKEFYK